MEKIYYPILKNWCMSTFNELRDRIQGKRDTLLQKQEQLFIAKMALDRYEQEIAKKVKKGKPDIKTDKKGGIPGKPLVSKIPAQKIDLKGGPIKGGPILDPTKLDPKLVLLSNAKSKFLGEINAIESELINLYQLFWALASPQDMVGNWDAKFPIVLLPIRIETRFITYDVGGVSKNYICVRFIPDDIFVDTHEPLLTADEYEGGKKYWSEISNPENDRLTNQKKEWRNLHSIYGSNRAAYIILKTRPLNFPIDINDPIPSELQYPPFTLSKENSWSLPARSYVIPDKFVVTLYNGGTPIVKTGNHVHAFPLILGPDPNSDADLFEEVEENGEVKLKMDERIRWLYDFEAAVANGMAVKIELTNGQYATGFDKITVLGLRLSSDQNHSQQLLEGLIDSHHYGQNGFGIVPQGTPTNNSKDKPSGYSQLRQDPTFSFQTEQESPLIGSLDISNKLAWKDGQWLAHGLGIQVNTLAHSYFANHYDRIEATAMNEALWYGTLGYYLKHMLVTWNTLSNDTLSTSDIGKMKDFFIAYISGRGPMPAIRVGNQPYGILPVTAYTKMEWASEELFPKKLHGVLKFFRQSWRTKVGNVKTTSQGSDNWQQDFLDILGLQSGSVEYYNRLAIGPLVYYLYAKQTSSGAEAWLDNQVAQSNLANSNINNLVADADLLLKNTRASMLSWFPFQSKINNGTVTQDPISEETPLSDDYIIYLIDETKLQLIIDEYLTNLNTNEKPLLYLMLRHSLLLIVWEILWKRFHGGEWIDKELLNAEKDEACRAVWYQFENTKGEKRKELIDYIKGNATYIDYTTSLKKLSKGSTGSIPTERLERLLSEHLDLCSYRFDAWQTGLVDYKLQKMRILQPNGCYLGAYGWVLNVRKDPDRTDVPNSQMPTLFNNDSQIHKLTYDEGNAGFIHAPSIAQATTSAVLREGYLSKGKEQMQVDLTSKRVRLAKEIIEGVQNGQELAALLGYRFERSLHDKSGNGLELDKYIYDLRKEFPLVTRKDNNAMDNFEANNVVHGLDLLKVFRSNNSMFSYAVDEDHLKKSCFELDDIIDAISDLTMAEGVHQAVLGNHIRANAILNSIGEGKNIPEPQFTETPRTGITLTQRMGVLFTKKENYPPIWADNSTYKASISPIINQWIGEILGDSSKIKCKVTYDNTTEIVSPNYLELEPIDFVILLNSPLGDESSEMAQRILYYIRKKNNLLKDVSIKIDYQDRIGFADTDVAFIEILAVARNIYRLMNESEVMLPAHLQRDSERSVMSDEELTAERNSINLEDVMSNVTDIIEIDEMNKYNILKSTNNLKAILDIDLMLNDLSEIINMIKQKAESNETFDLSEIENELFKLSFLGIQGSIPSNQIENYQDSKQILLYQVISVLKELYKRNEQIKEASISTYQGNIEALKIAFGKDVPILPTYEIKNFAEVKSSFDNKENLISHATSKLVMEDWLSGISKVKDKVQNWQTYALLNDIKGSDIDTKIHALQLPYQVDDQWMGIEYSKGGDKIAAETLSLVLNIPFGFPATSSKNVGGLIIEEWVEKIPNKEEITGIAFNYDEPQTEAPQAILLCVPPTNRSNWSWDDLISTLDETLETAQLRAIDPDLLEKSPGSEFNKFLPSIVHPISSDHKQTVVLNQPK
jgi:hypothetical protein